MTEAGVVTYAMQLVIRRQRYFRLLVFLLDLIRSKLLLEWLRSSVPGFA
jgi:hypothetical protein